MEVVDEARSFVQAKMQSRVALLRAKTRRLQQINDAPVPPEAEMAPEVLLPRRELQLCPVREGRASRRRAPRPVLAFSFRHPPPAPVVLDADGAVRRGLSARRGDVGHVEPWRRSCGLQSCNAWAPWPPYVGCEGKAYHFLRAGFFLDDSDEEAEPGRPKLVSRESTWESMGYSGLLGNESRQASKSERGSIEDHAEGVARLAFSSMRNHQEEESSFGSKDPPLCHLEEEPHVARRISSDEHTKWRSSFNRFRHDGEIHRDDLDKALAHCGFDDRRGTLIMEALESVTLYAALSRDEFMQFVCLYESRLHELYRAEFLKYERGPGTMSVESLPLLLSELGLEPRRVVIEELLQEVCGAKPGSLEFRDVAAVMELLRAREGFLVEELERFRAVFQDFDSDASGDMSAAELGSALSWLGFPYTNEKVQSLYKQSDMNGNGVLSESEFVICLRHIQDAELSTIRQVLRRSPSDGHISSVRELEVLLMTLGYQASAPALADAMQEAKLCPPKMDPEQLQDLAIHMDMDAVCLLLHCLRNREGFTDAQMNDLRRAFQKNKQEETDRISTSNLHKVLRWLGHCYSFDRAQQLIYEADAQGDELDFTTFVKLVRRCRNFDRQAAVAAFHEADERCTGVLETSGQLQALSQLQLSEFHQAPKPGEKEITLERFLLKVLRFQEDRLLFLRKYYCFTVAEYENLRFLFNRSDKEGNGTLKRQELARLVEALFPNQAHMPQFRPVLVKLLKDSEKNISVDLMALLAVTRKIKDETEIYQCSVYAAALRDMGFQTREAAEFLSIFLPVTDEGAQPLICEDLVNLFTRSFEMTDSECQSLYSIFEQVLAEDKGVMVTSSAGPPREGLDFLGFMLLMRRVIDAGIGNNWPQRASN